MNVDIIFPDAAVKDDEQHKCVGWVTLLGNQFDSVQAAESYVNAHVDDYAYNAHFIIQPVGHWIACAHDVESLQKVHTISSPSNTNPTKGKHGSVNDLKKSAYKNEKQDTEEHPAVTPMTNHEKKQEVNNHIARIESLLKNVPDSISSETAYADSRHHLASLLAYARNLTTLLLEAKSKRKFVEEYISGIDQKYADYKHEWRQRYADGLKQSGFKAERGDTVSVIDFLDTPISQDGQMIFDADNNIL